MGLLLILVGYFFDFRNDKKNFFNDLKAGAIYFLINIIFFLFLYKVIKIGLLYCIFGFAIEIVVLFSFKAYLQHKEN